jgi:hypothetical protein
MRNAYPFGLIFATLLTLGAPQLAAAQNDSLDVPRKKEVVEFGPSPYYPSAKVPIKLSCDLYEDFMVKEYDEGQKGAEWLAIVPVKERVEPPCTKSHAADEKVIVYPEWSGYFKGAKGNFVIFHAEDGVNGGMPFVIYDSRTGKQLFQDSYFYAGMWSTKFPDSPFNDIRVNITRDGQVFLKYLRVEEGGCDLHLERTACWPKVIKKFALKTTSAPVCSGYQGITTRYESALAYPVEVSLFPQPSTRTIEGPVRCWPVD